MKKKAWTCATCETANGETNRFCAHCGEARADTSAPARTLTPFIPPWERPGWKPSTLDNVCDEEGCSKTVREHIEEFRAITRRPRSVFTRPSQRPDAPEIFPL
jgi:hypothetical protein